jgi:hypothetical protein
VPTRPSRFTAAWAFSAAAYHCRHNPEIQRLRSAASAASRRVGIGVPAAVQEQDRVERGSVRSSGLDRYREPEQGAPWTR